ncbi:orotidine-5'-phosphate decarboxylase [Kaarinaea lacus]
MTESANPRVIVALDYDNAEEAINLARSIDPAACRVKVGKELFTRAGPSLVEKLRMMGFEVFLDLKFHDIPNTVAQACRAAADLGVWMVNVHTLGGRRMMEAARNALDSTASSPLLIGVTVLTSMGAEDLHEVGLTGEPEDNVVRLASLAKDSGLDGVVCSPREVAVLRRVIGKSFSLVTPGVRPTGSSTDDQKRITTPEEAIASGSSYLVIGRPITQSENPRLALEKINSVILPLLSV